MSLSLGTMPFNVGFKVTMRQRGREEAKGSRLLTCKMVSFPWLFNIQILRVSQFYLIALLTSLSNILQSQLYSSQPYCTFRSSQNAGMGRPVQSVAQRNNIAIASRSSKAYKWTTFRQNTRPRGLDNSRNDCYLHSTL